MSSSTRRLSEDSDLFTAITPDGRLSSVRTWRGAPAAGDLEDDPMDPENHWLVEGKPRFQGGPLDPGSMFVFGSVVSPMISLDLVISQSWCPTSAQKVEVVDGRWTPRPAATPRVFFFGWSRKKSTA